MAIAKVWRAVVGMTFAGLVTVQNTFHFASDDPGIGPGNDARDLATRFKGDLLATAGRGWSWRLTVTPAITFHNLSVTSLYPDGDDNAGVSLDGTPGDFTFSNNIGGGALAFWPTAPVDVAGILTWRTGAAGRQNRGRTYVCGLPYPTIQTVSPFFPTLGQYADSIAPSDGAVLGVPNDSFPRTRIDKLGAHFLDYWCLGGAHREAPYYLGVFSRTRGGSHPPIDPSGFRPITDYSVPNYWATMGSRRGGRGI